MPHTTTTATGLYTSWVFLLWAMYKTVVLYFYEAYKEFIYIYVHPGLLPVHQCFIPCHVWNNVYGVRNKSYVKDVCIQFSDLLFNKKMKAIKGQQYCFTGLDLISSLD